MKMVLKKSAGILALMAALFFFGCAVDDHSDGAESEVRVPVPEESTGNDGDNTETDSDDSGNDSSSDNAGSGGSSTPDKPETGGSSAASFYHTRYGILDFDCSFVKDEVLDWQISADGKSYTALVVLDGELKNADKISADAGSEITEFTFTLGGASGYWFSSAEEIPADGSEAELSVGKTSCQTTVTGIQAKYGTELSGSIPKTIKLAGPIQIVFTSTEGKISVSVLQS